MCGIFGFSGKEGYSPLIYKLEVLGIYNATRGTDSCGYYYSGNIVKGVDNDSDWRDFVANRSLIKGDINDEVFLGHTRKATSGKHTLQNAHPHIVDNYVQVHNGVIYNAEELCKKYNITDIKDKIDSALLAELINKVGFNILEEYVGYASLAIAYKNTPGLIVLFHGQSREINNRAIYEERPLYFLKQKEGIYFSSMINSLKYINEEDEKIYNLKYNHVVPIMNGEILFNEIKPINRDNKNIGISSFKYNNRSLPYLNGSNYSSYYNHSNYYSSSKHTTKADNDVVVSFNKDDKIFVEPFPSEYYKKNNIYYHYGRYYNSDSSLLNGIFNIHKSGIITNDTGPDIKRLRFFNGILIKRMFINNQFDEQYVKTLEGITEMSKYSMYPLVCNDVERKNSQNKDSSYLWMRNGTIVRKETVHPMFSNRTYVIRNGRTTEIKERK